MISTSFSPSYLFILFLSSMISFSVSMCMGISLLNWIHFILHIANYIPIVFQMNKRTFVRVFINLFKQCFFLKFSFYFIKYIHDNTMSVANLYRFVLFGLFMSLKMKVDLICLQLFSFFLRAIYRGR